MGKMGNAPLHTRASRAIEALKEAEDLARHKGDHGEDLSDMDLIIIGNACEEAIMVIRLLLAKRVLAMTVDS